MDIGVPENEPASYGLADIYSQDTLGRGIADDANDNRIIYDVLKFLDVDDVPQKTSEKGATPKGNNSKVGGNPKPKGEVVVQVSLIKGQTPT
jgi:hypothetical protein